ncbi:hypothetical protein UlMin_006846 [Ulmus minor]
MDFCQNVSVSSEYKQEQLLSSSFSKPTGFSSGLDDLFSAQNTESDLNLEWLSVFVEDCLSSKGECLPPPTGAQNTTITPNPSKALELEKPQQKPLSLQTIVVPSKARSKRRRAIMTRNKNPLTSWSNNLIVQSQNFQIPSSDPPLLQQAYWLADSELIVPKKDENINIMGEKGEEIEEEKKDFSSLEGNINNGGQPMPRRCTHCLSQRTPQWRAGPLGPKTLCNACGVRYKSGRLLPEYRPAKSPTFVSYLHSNSHKKVMEMRNSHFHS